MSWWLLPALRNDHIPRRDVDSPEGEKLLKNKTRQNKNNGVQGVRWPRHKGFHPVTKECIENMLGPVCQHTIISGSWPFWALGGWWWGERKSTPLGQLTCLWTLLGRTGKTLLSKSSEHKYKMGKKKTLKKFFLKIKVEKEKISHSRNHFICNRHQRWTSTYVLFSWSRRDIVLKDGLITD